MPTATETDSAQRLGDVITAFEENQLTKHEFCHRLRNVAQEVRAELALARIRLQQIEADHERNE
jgi:hypothetical protein